MTNNIETHLASLQEKLQQERLTAPQVIEGVEECFILTHRAFIGRRRPELSQAEADEVSVTLLNSVLDPEFKGIPNPAPNHIRQAVLVLDERFGFAAEPELADQHTQVIDTLLEKMETPSQLA